MADIPTPQKGTWSAEPIDQVSLTTYEHREQEFRARLPQFFREQLEKEWNSSLTVTKSTGRQQVTIPQLVFDQIHPVGWAKRIRIDRVSFNWRAGSPGTSIDDIDGYQVTATLLWTGPLTQDGYTEIAMGHDLRQNALTEFRVLRTNGITKQDLCDAGYLLTQLALDALLNSQ